MRKDQSRVDELHGSQFNILLRQIDTVEINTMEMRISLPEDFEMPGVYVQPNYPCRHPAVNVVESVSASDSQDRD